MENASRTIVLGVDAMDKDLVLEWAQAGVLPTFRGLLERGAWAITAAPPGLYVGAIWPSFSTGVSPGRHGRFSPVQLRTGTYDFYDFRPQDIKAEPFWIILSRRGRRVTIIDVPKTCTSPDVNGIQLVDWATHDPDLGFSTWPTSLASEITARFGRGRDASVSPGGSWCNITRRTAADYAELRDGLLASVARKAALTRYFLEKNEWDLLISVFTESHCVGHQAWHLHDPSHPRHDPEMAGAVGNPIQQVYVAIDAAVGQLLQQVGPETTVFVFASHGMGPHYDGTLMLNEILRRLEKGRPLTARPGVARVLGWARSWPPLGVRNLLRPVKKAVRTAVAAVPAIKEDITTRRSFRVLSSDACAGIRINVAGREPHGRVRPGPEYDALCEALSRDLLALVNVATGRPAVRRVLKTRQLYQGTCVDDLPDLLVEWSREAPISALDSPKTGIVRRTYGGIRTGDHKPEGLLIATGPSVPAGRLDGPIPVMDIAPTIAASLGVSLTEAEGVRIAALS